MARKKGKSVSFDAMVKFFMNQYSIPTKKDVDKILARLDRMEKLIRMSNRGRSAVRAGAGSDKSTVTASDMVMNTIKRFRQGATFSDLQTRTGFNEKKLRNIIFRLNKLGKIKRKSRGVYIAA